MKHQCTKHILALFPQLSRTLSDTQNHMSPETVINYQLLILLVLRRGKKTSKSSKIKTVKPREKKKVKPSLYTRNSGLKNFILCRTLVSS